MSKKNEYLIYSITKFDDYCYVNNFVSVIHTMTIDKRLKTTVSYTMNPENAVRVDGLMKCIKLCNYLNSYMPYTFDYDRVGRLLKPNAYNVSTYHHFNLKAHDYVCPTRQEAELLVKYLKSKGIHSHIFPLYGYVKRHTFDCHIVEFSEAMVHLSLVDL